MNRNGRVSDGDTIRIFFNSQARLQQMPVAYYFYTYQVPYVGALVPEIVGIISSELSSSEASQTSLNLLAQANGLVQALFTNAFQYRTHNRAKYQLSRAFVQPWTSEPNLLLNLRRLFDITVQFRIRVPQPSLAANNGVLGRDNPQDVLTPQLRELASYLFRVYSDRLDFLETCGILYQI